MSSMVSGIKEGCLRMVRLYPLVISDAGTIVLLSRFPLSRSSIDSGIESRE